MPHMDKHYRNEYWPEREPEGRTQPADIGEESEAEARDRAETEFADMIFSAQEFIEERYELTLAIARAACIFDATPSETNRLELVRAVDAAREEYIEWRTRV